MEQKKQKFREKHRMLLLSDKIIAILFGVIVSIMFIQVVFRYLLNSSLSWSEELVRYLFVWMTFLGGAIALRDKMHIGIDYFIELFPEKYKKLFQFFNISLIIVFNIFLSGIGLAWVYNDRGILSSALSLPVNIALYTALPLTSILAAWYGIQRVKREANEINNEKPET